MIKTVAVTLEQILQAKEARKVRQEQWLHQYRVPLVSISMNIPGPHKDSEEIRQLCDYAVEEIRERLPVAAFTRLNLATGPEALLAVQSTGNDSKQVCIAIEEEHPFGRLLDLDVIDLAGIPLSRTRQGQARNCFLCGKPASHCMREQRHSAEQIQQAVQRLFSQFAAYNTRKISKTAERIGALAVEAMLYEVSCTPSPGLVDRINAGAHRDMDFFSFMASSAALAVSMARCAQAGLNHKKNITGLLDILRYIGLEGEKAMFAATQGVNTQKGLLFSLGIAAAAAGLVLQAGQQLVATGVMDVMAAMVTGIVERELSEAAQKPPERRTAGEQLYVQYGATGIRGELEKKLPAVRRALPQLKDLLQAGVPVNDALINTLLLLMTCVEDTTVMHRHQPEKMLWVREQAQRALTEGGMCAENGYCKVSALDQAFIMHNVSPGGAADLLAVTWFLHQLENR